MPELVLPDYDGPCLNNVIPPLLIGSVDARPAWFPAPLRQSGPVVLLVLDGLGWNQFRDHRSLMPTLASMEGGSISSVVPSTTATALTSLCTGSTPLEHGIVGYRIDMGDTIMNSLRWGDGRRDLRNAYPPESVQPVPPFCGRAVFVVSRSEHEQSGFTRAHMRGARFSGWRNPSSIAIAVRGAIISGGDLVYAYYDGIDKVAHEYGFGDHYEAELRFADSLVATVLDQLPSGAVLAIVADHGQVETGARIVHLHDDVLRLVSHQSGEGRFRWLHAREGCAAALRDACDRYAPIAWIRTRDEVLTQGWFGRSAGHQSRVASRRFGDVALAPHGPHAFDDPADTGPFALVCRHGSMTPDEMLVPFLARLG